MTAESPSKIVPIKPAFNEMNAELKARLLSNLPAVLISLLPNGVMRAGKFFIGDLKGNSGDSMVVELNGPKAGLWHDFATSDGGDIFDLWAAVKGIDKQTRFPDLIQDMQRWLGSPPPAPPIRQDKSDKEDLGPVTGRWHYTDKDGVLLATVYRYDPPNRKKQFRPWDAKRGKMQAPEPRPLYNQPALAGSPFAILVEGEKCAEALTGAGFCATTAMNGSNAPIDKTDWSPLEGKHVLIWPDHDDAGLSYARMAASAVARAGATCVEILKIPADKPPKWDSADAVAEGLAIADILKTWGRVVAKEKPRMPAEFPLYSVAELAADHSPVPPDLIAPRVLTPGGMLVFGGAPKVGKSDFLITLLAHMAAGQSFLGMSANRPLSIFYLQAEVQYHYLRERIQKLRLPDDVYHHFERNFMITSQIRLLLDERGIERVVQAVSKKFTAGMPDIIAIDPIRNVFDSGTHPGGENDNDGMMYFLQERVETLRMRINPDAGIILTHHTKKISKKGVEEDPFQALSGAGSLRSYYTSGMLLFRPDEQKPERTLIFELRNGPEIPQKIITKQDGVWQELDPKSERLLRAPKEDAEALRRRETILRLIHAEAQQGCVYTANQFAEHFENRSGLGSSRAVRERIHALANAGCIKFFKNASAYGLLQPQRTAQGYMCVEGMSLGHDGQPVLPTHFRHPESGAIMEVDDPLKWVYFGEVA